MSQFHDTELQRSEIKAEPIDKEPVSVGKRTPNRLRRMRRGARDRMGVRTAVLAVAAIVILALPLGTLLSIRTHLFPKLPVFFGTQSRPADRGSAVLAVDTFGLTIRVKNASPSTQELFEQAAVAHLARLHRTYSRWADSNHELMGRLLLRLTVDATGRVVSVDPVASNVTNASFTKTVMADVRKWKFPRGGVETAEMTVPLLFVPKGMDPDTVVQWERKVRNAQKGETSAAVLRVANKASISAAGEHAQKSLPSIPHSDQTNTFKAPTAHLPKPGTEEEALVVFKTNRAVAIREYPRFSSKIVRELDADTRLSIVENKGEWLKIKMADASFVGFVRKEFVSPVNE